MFKGSLRQVGFAAIPVVLLGQCAPQCAPAPAPISVQYHDVTSSVGESTFLADLSPSGRFVTVFDNGGGTGRLDLLDRSSTEVPMRGLLTADGSAVVGLDDGAVSFRYIATGAEVARVALPSEWGAQYVSAISANGGRAVIAASNGQIGDDAAFQVDLATGVWTKLDSPLGGDAFGNRSYDPLISDDGTTTIFEFQDGPTGCVRCTDVWARRGAGSSLELVSPTATGAVSETGDSEVVDISADGRYVLFFSTSTDLAGGAGSAAGRLFVRDLVARTTSELPIVPSEIVGTATISDDGNRIAFATDRPTDVNGTVMSIAFPALLERSTGRVTDLAPDGSYGSGLWSRSPVLLSGDGRRVAFSTNGTGDTPHVIIADITGG